MRNETSWADASLLRPLGLRIVDATDLRGRVWVQCSECGGSVWCVWSPLGDGDLPPSDCNYGSFVCPDACNEASVARPPVAVIAGLVKDEVQKELRQLLPEIADRAIRSVLRKFSRRDDDGSVGMGSGSPE